MLYPQLCLIKVEEQVYCTNKVACTPSQATLWLVWFLCDALARLEFEAGLGFGSELGGSTIVSYEGCSPGFLQ